MAQHPLVLLSVLILAGCGPAGTNAPTDPAAPIHTAESDAPPPTPPPGFGSVLPGSGPQTFVGRWAARNAWCAYPRGPERPIEISTTRFEGYENRCEIAAIRQVADGYEAELACAGEGVTSNERIRMAVQGDAMRLTWLSRDQAVISLVRCPAAPVSPTKPVAEPS